MHEINIWKEDKDDTYRVIVQDNTIYFKGDNAEERANAFVLKLLIETGRIGA